MNADDNKKPKSSSVQTRKNVEGTLRQKSAGATRKNAADKKSSRLRPGETKKGAIWKTLKPDGATKNGRIDYILYSKSAPNLVVVSSKVYDTRDANGYKPSDHRPVVTTFEVR